ncbi:hypothetical protein [Sulfurospirillum sp. hDNRA2]|nr:hypothetical protein [Sulfurospirillum sp. DNRA8]MCR1811260.1 hypothetical protein [Sulfurospirillum sp. DNRA8]
MLNRRNAAYEYNTLTYRFIFTSFSQNAIVSLFPHEGYADFMLQ